MTFGLDVVPANFPKEFSDTVGPSAIDIINISLVIWIFPFSFKHAVVHSLLENNEPVNLHKEQRLLSLKWPMTFFLNIDAALSYI